MANNDHESNINQLESEHLENHLAEGNREERRGQEKLRKATIQNRKFWDTFIQILGIFAK
jgi:hypothetical protein